MELVHEIPCGAPDGPVDGNGVPHRVLDNEHPWFFCVLAQSFDVKADQGGGDVHGSAVVEEFQRTVYIEVKRLGYPVGFQDMLEQQGVHQVAQNRHILRPGVGKVGLVDHLYRPVNDGFLNSLQSRLAAHDELAEG